MARGLYKLDITLTTYPPDEGEVADVVEVGRGTKWAYLYSARSPNAALEALGATLLGEGWVGAWKAATASDRGRVFDAEWDEDEAPESLDAEPRSVVRRGKLRDVPGGRSAVPRAILVPVAFGERERDAEQRALNRETGKGA